MPDFPVILTSSRERDVTMATDNFHARLKRINESHADLEPVSAASIRELRSVGMVRTRGKSRKRHPVWDHLVSIAFGIVLGCLAAVALIGLTLDGSPWGPGTELQNMVYYPAMGGLGLAPLLLVVSMVVASKKPGIALFSLGYLTGMTVTLFV